MSEFTHILIDGSYLARKAFYVHDLSVDIDGKIIPTGIAYGSLATLSRLVRESLTEKGKMIICWDRGYKDKLKIFPGYKEKRRQNKIEDKEKAKDEIKFLEGRKLFERMLDQTGFYQAHCDGEEADDVISSLAFSITERRDTSVLIYSSDKDLFQLARDRIFLSYGQFRGKDVVYGPEEIYYKTKLTPKDYLIYQILNGCKGDEIPGIPGVGDKTARKIIAEMNREHKKVFHVEGKLESIPKPIIRLLVQKKKMDVDGKDLKYWTEYLDRNKQLMRAITKLEGIKFKRGKNNEDKLVDLFIDHQFVSFIKGKKVRNFLK